LARKPSVFKLPLTAAALAALTFLATSGCTSFQQQHVSVTPPTSLPAGGVVFVADGAGDFRATSEALRRAIAAEHLPLALRTFVWSHGYCRVVADQVDLDHAQKEGQRLADLIRVTRQACPEKPIYLIAHSAGSSVALCAAESLPADSVERIILLAPSVSADYDLRAALHASRRGIDVFCSRSDCWYLRISTLVTSLTHGKRCSAAGRVGFHPVIDTPEDAVDYMKLQHYPWQPSMSWTGHDGGHFGYYQQGYLRAFVLPLLFGPPQPG